MPRPFSLPLRGNPEPKKNPVPLTASVRAVTGDAVQMKFIDCIATYQDEKYDKDHPDGYGEVREDKDGTLHVSYSEVQGMVFGMTAVVIYPPQFGIPCTPGTYFRFVFKPQDFIDGCVQAVAEELCPPEYVI
jgi:hypothetical protein